MKNPVIAPITDYYQRRLVVCDGEPPDGKGCSDAPPFYLEANRVQASYGRLEAVQFRLQKRKPDAFLIHFLIHRPFLPELSR